MKPPKNSNAAVGENRERKAWEEAKQLVSSPVSDPTNPYHQESTGDWVAGEYASERHNHEPGMTDCVREWREC